MLIGICGGIGSGKSVVSRIMRLKGFAVYDCDYEARKLMSVDTEIKSRIRDEISPEVTDGTTSPDRRRLAAIVFNDEQARLKLNHIVHGAILKDVAGKDSADDILWVEAAILAESGLAQICDRIWRVDAPESLRIRRASHRDSCKADDIAKRIASQRKEEELLKEYQDKTDIILNDDRHSLILRIDDLLSKSLESLRR
ncbi:MAG: dephospho-CoA kinase [Muribaculaceae bacterium]|nr:dephospho-CoA kinase [Muribaculaceae bacterium]MDE6558922.1 dephospho-CoA kinase [Muribaculaceae bacterium]